VPARYSVNLQDTVRCGSFFFAKSTRVVKVDRLIYLSDAQRED